jgi:hypothetical protein
MLKFVQNVFTNENSKKAWLVGTFIFFFHLLNNKYIFVMQSMLFIVVQLMRVVLVINVVQFKIPNSSHPGGNLNPRSSAPDRQGKQFCLLKYVSKKNWQG